MNKKKIKIDLPSELKVIKLRNNICDILLALLIFGSLCFLFMFSVVDCKLGYLKNKQKAMENFLDITYVGTVPQYTYKVIKK